MHLILDLRCGISGDMMLGALLDWYEKEIGDIEPVLEKISKSASVMSPTNVWVRNTDREGEKVKRLYVEWERLDEDTCSGREMLKHLNSGLNINNMNSRIQKLATRILMNILESEAVVHNERDFNEVHLHEAGTPDTLVDVIGIAYVADKLEVDGYWVKATPVSLGMGTISTAHGVYEIPVPAVRHMIRGIPVRSGPVEGELTTPTGIAAAKALVEIWMDENEAGDGLELPGVLVGRGAGEREYLNGFSNTLRIYEEADQ